MHLAFNATALLSPLTGIGQYSFHLAHGLMEQEDIDLELFYGAYWDKRLNATPSNTLASSLPWLRRHVPYSYELRRWVQNFRFNQGIKQKKFDIYHEPNILSLKFDGPTVITVHDLSWIRHPDAHPIERVKAMNRYFEGGLRKADAIITDSIFVKQELMDVFGISPGLISSIPLGVESLFKPMTANHTEVILRKYDLVHRQYFLAVGTLEPRKNLSLALKAYLQLPVSIRNVYPLVLIGMKGWHTSALELQLLPLIRTGQVRQLGYLERIELATLMAGALTLVYPSIYEGFGLPPLEAMASGVPVICANSSSLPEVVGDAGVLVDPYNDTDLVQVLLQMIEDNLWRSEMAGKAIQRASMFTWQICVEKTIAVYQTIASAS
jgi:alpha-1,3-rhamnosyl/mannosyltransferase